MGRPEVGKKGKEVKRKRERERGRGRRRKQRKKDTRDYSEPDTTET